VAARWFCRGRLGPRVVAHNFKGAILIGPSTILVEHWACPQ